MANENWLQGQSIYNIGGRCTDIAQIGYTIRSLIKEYYPVNGVPSNIAVRLDELCQILKDGEIAIENFIRYMEEDNGSEKDNKN